MGLWCSYFYLVIILIVSAEERNSTIRYSERRGKALKISKKSCTDPNGRKGICTFKWDCINHNGTLMGTCVDGFIFGTCCQYDYDPLLHDDFQNNPFIFDDSNNIRDDERLETTKKTTTTTTVPTAASRPAFTTRRPFITTRKPPTSTSASTLSGQLVTWTSIGPTRRPVPQRPIILSPFPFRPGTNFPSSQGAWPMGVAFPVDPFQMNRPLSPFRPPILIQSAQSNVANQIVLHPGTTSFTILSDSNVTPSSTKDEMTTISVPIPQWSTTSSARPTSLRPLITSVSKTSETPGITTVASLYSQGNLSTIGQTTSTTQKPIRNPPLDYRKDCGVRTIGPRGRIVGGQSAYFGRWPWQIGNFYSEIQKTIQPFYKVIGDLDMSKGSEQLKPANDAYGSGVPGMYYKKYLLLRQAVAKDQGEWTRNRGRGATYIHWGKQNCIEVADKMSDGIVVGPQKNGGGSNFICLSKLPKTGTSSPDQNNAAILQ
ncbi:uncharacterized protein LOC118188135, partial [Stegodyphus dumicola]|uniref:uncharacterized protein LOC118188135 n=1 Tax=Stegodyphus dumicola TaxID=202533 RepID=UPI0015A8B82A